MAQRNSERLLNLVIALLGAPRFISREQIRSLVDGYARASSEQAFQRMFERDKEDLRTLGLEILVGPVDPYTDEMDGYRIQQEDVYLPQIHLTPTEATLVGLACSVWSHTEVAGTVTSAVAKLRALGQEIESDQVSFLAPRLTAREPSFPRLWEALVERTPVSFTYHGKVREVHPWRLILRSGAWYLLGEVVGTGARIFKLARIEGLPEKLGSPASYHLPSADLVRASTQALEPAEPTARVRLALRECAAGSLRRRGEVIGPASLEGYDLVEVPYAREDEIISAVCSMGADALVVSPPEIRDAVLAHLRAIVEGGQ